MIQTIILLCIQGISVYFSVKQLGNIVEFFSLTTILKSMYITCLQAPLIEESLFRGTLKSYLIGVPYGDYINSILFGLVHVPNCMVHNNIRLTIFQVFATTYLGYYVVQFDNFIYSFLVHVYYNTFITLCSFAIIYFKNKCGKINDEINSINSIQDYKSISQIKCPTSSKDDSFISLKCDISCQNKDYEYIPKNKIRKDTIDRIDKLNSIINKRENTFVFFS